MNAEIEIIKTLLQKVGKIVDEDNKIQEEREQKGEKFNLFNVLGLWSDEVRLHSAFLAELLNPKGKHGLRSRFLQAFIEIINSSQKLEIDLNVDNANVEVEVYIGKVDSVKATGGRIDVLISDGVKAVIIENKIYAGDSNQQLTRYYNYGKEKYKVDKDKKDNFDILYLSLFGADASEASAGKDKERVPYTSISYYYDILKWLERCLEISVRQPLVRESINQYITLIKQLTNQNMENDIQNNIVEILSSKESYAAATKIENMMDSVRVRIVENEFLPIMNIIANECNSQCVIERNNPKGFSFWIIPEKWKKNKIYFSFQGYTHFGIWRQDNIDNMDQIIAETRKYGYKDDKWWFSRKEFKKYYRFNNYERLFDQEYILYSDIKSCIKEMIEITKDLDM